MRPSPQTTMSPLLLVGGSSIVAFVFFCILTAAIGFFYEMPISSFYFFLVGPLTFLFAAAVTSVFPCRGKIVDTIFVFAFLLISFFLTWVISRSFFDLSYDGQAYHQEAIFHLSRGWNPFYQTLSDWQVNRMGRWLQHYSKGIWIIETTLLKGIGEIEGAKLFHLWLMGAVFSMAFSFLRRFQICSVFRAFLVSFLVAFNPVSIYQSLSFYLDGQLMSLVVILILTFAYIYKEPRPFYYALLFMVISVLVNVKLTAPVYTTILVGGYLVILWISGKERLLIPVFVTATGALLVGLVLFGFSPYVANTLHRGNPLYPALGTDRSDYTFPQFPGNFEGRNSVSLLFFSIFSKCDNLRGPDKKAVLKIPFTVSREEMNAFTDTNAKQGGFGPLFGGAILLSLSILIGASIHLWRVRGLSGLPGEQERLNILLALLSSAFILGSSLINPASSLARFIPQMWLFPICAFLISHSLSRPFFKILGNALLLILFLNNLLIATAYYPYNWNTTRLYRDRFEALALESRKSPLHFYFGHFLSSAQMRFDQFGIHYGLVEKKEDCRDGERILPHSIVLRCK